MSDLVTPAELVRRVTEAVVAQLGATPVANSNAAADEDAFACPIYSAPIGDRTVERGFIPIGISARHLHVTPAQVEILFGKGAALTPFKPLRQTGQFAAKETVSLIGPRGRAIERVRILGPCRNETQVELSLTDCVQLGVDAPVRPSGDHRDTSGILIVGPAGHLAITTGVIRANRHVHLHTKEAAALGLRDQDRIMIKIDGDKPVLYYDVQVRVSDKFLSELHLDTDDANAVGLPDGAFAQIVRNPAEIPFCEVVGRR